MKLDNLTNQVYIVAINEAKLKSHEFVTPEHFLYAALMFGEGKAIIENSGGNVEDISNELNNYFTEYLTIKESENPLESYSFVKMFELAVAHVQNAGKDNVTLGDVLVAIFNLKQSFAVYIMVKNGANRLSMLKYISHEMKSENKQSETHEDKKQVDEKKGNLAKYSINLTEMAKKGELDPFVGREDIIERTVQVLMRRTKNNPIHVGDAGVGKTAIVEGLAQKIANGEVPEKLKNSNIYTVDMSGVLAGTKFRGDFEERLITILDEASKEKNSIIYIDEIHTIVGAGAVSGGSLDATSILKPYLVKGTLKFIGSTTFDEYKKYFEKDSALTRRFQKVDVLEPSIEKSVEILKGVRNKYEKYHKVIYSDAIIKYICELSAKHINDTKLPDKAIDVLDETGARVCFEARTKTRTTITKNDVEKTVSLIAKIPMNSITENEAVLLRNLDTKIKTMVYGQDKAVETVVDAIKASRSGLNSAEKPIASLLFVGPTGVGKTEIAKQLAECLNIGLVRFDMSEYQESHSVARLIGSPPGYVGYEEGGLMTDAIRKTPHCVLLLDEIEKAHQDIMNILLQVMDYGSLTDNSGKKADFRNVILIMTSNAGARDMSRRTIGFDETRYNDNAMDRELEKVFSPEFRNRLDEIVKFNRVDEEMALLIAKKAVSQLAERINAKNIKLEVSDEAINWIAQKGLSPEFGAREIIRVVDKELKKLLVDRILFADKKKQEIIKVAIENGKLLLV